MSIIKKNTHTKFVDTFKHVSELKEFVTKDALDKHRSNKRSKDNDDEWGMVEKLRDEIIGTSNIKVQRVEKELKRKKKLIYLTNAGLVTQRGE